MQHHLTGRGLLRVIIYQDGNQVTFIYLKLRATKYGSFIYGLTKNNPENHERALMLFSLIEFPKNHKPVTQHNSGGEGGNREFDLNFKKMNLYVKNFAVQQ